MSKKSNKHTTEFKQSAIQLALSKQKPIKQIAEDLGIHPKTLYGWISTHRMKHGYGVSTSPNLKVKASRETLEEENKLLRKELKFVKEEREILKKAAAYFAKETL